MAEMQNPRDDQFLMGRDPLPAAGRRKSAVLTARVMQDIDMSANESIFSVNTSKCLLSKGRKFGTPNVATAEFSDEFFSRALKSRPAAFLITVRTRIDLKR